ncbi:MAG: FIG01147157: hypothetical protein [uncultured Sulfurovum sp.]|uniref:DUF302 domain-containing protein n=1 Tax=uncultured Sulfurovum sp. TaxID=269237 RepID=A0A6S6TLN3_9BACT|nr:MAG: FIG01147157: hypothetical protein [uncultured Sulfurovum sp.]
MKLIIKNMLLTSLLLTSVVAIEATKVEKIKETKVVETTEDIKVFTADNKDGKITPKTIQAAFEKAGFFVSANRDMNTPFEKQFKETSFDVYNLFTFYKKDVVLELAKKYENVGLFAPMSMSIYTKKGDKKISVSTLSAEAMAKIMKIPADEKLLTDLRALVVQALESALTNGKFEKLAYKVAKASGELVTTYSMEMDAEEWEDELDELKMGFEGELAPNGFVIAGHNNLGDDFEEENYEGYDFYEVYSVCKLPVIYSIANTRPEAGAFAPCSLYFAKKKDEDEMKAAFPSVYNWVSSLAISDKKDLKVLEDAQATMNKILTSLME